jgi:hypothetical protein
VTSTWFDWTDGIGNREKTQGHWLFAASSVDRCLALPPPLDFVTPCVIQPGNHDQQINIGRSLKLNPNWPVVVSPHFPIKDGQSSSPPAKM